MIEKSRRIGISWAEAAGSVLEAAKTEGCDTWYVGYNQDMAVEFINDCSGWARNYQLAAQEVEEVVLKDEDRDILAFRIRFASGYRVTALSSRPSNLRGKQGRVVIDEAAYHDDLPGLLKAAIALLMWGGRVAVISTHDGVTNAFNQLIEDIRAGKKNYSLHRVTLDDALAEGLYKKICQVNGDRWTPELEEAWRQDLLETYGIDADEELLCIPRQAAEVYFPRVLVERCMNVEYPVLRLALGNDFTQLREDERETEVKAWCDRNLKPLLHQIPQHLRTYFGEDFGRSGDLTAIAPLVEETNLTRYSPFLIELRNVPFKQQEQILLFMCDRLPNFQQGALDGRGNGSYIAEQAKLRYGSRIEVVMGSADWYRDNVPRYRAAMEERKISIPSDVDVLKDHEAVKMDRGVPKVPDSMRYKGSDGGQRHGDAFVGLLMAWYATTLNSSSGNAGDLLAALC